MVFGSTTIYKEVYALLAKLDWNITKYTPVVVYHLVCRLALHRQVCRGRDCGTCGGGYCADLPSLGLNEFPKLAELYRSYRKREVIWPESTKEAFWADYFMDGSIREYKTLDHAISEMAEVLPESAPSVVRRAWERRMWVSSREVMWG